MHCSRSCYCLNFSRHAVCLPPHCRRHVSGKICQQSCCCLYILQVHLHEYASAPKLAMLYLAIICQQCSGYGFVFALIYHVSLQKQMSWVCSAAELASDQCAACQTMPLHACIQQMGVNNAIAPAGQRIVSSCPPKQLQQQATRSQHNVCLHAYRIDCVDQTTTQRGSVC